MRIYVDWRPQVIGAANEEEKLLGHRGSPDDDCQMGEMDAILLGIQLSPGNATILTDSNTAVRMVHMVKGGKPHPNAKHPKALMDRAKEIRDKLGDRQLAWIPRNANKAHQPLDDFWRNYV